MSRIVNRGFAATLVAITIAAELALRAAAVAPPPIVRIVYGTTLAMYMEVAKRLAIAAPEVRVLAMGDSLAMTQFQPDIFAADHGLPPQGVFNASYLALTFRSQADLLKRIGLDRFSKLRRVLIFVNPRRLTADGNIEADIFHVAMPHGPLDYSRLYGLSRYLVTASWRQIGRPTSWDEVEYLTSQGGVAFDDSRPTADRPGYPYQLLREISEEFVGELREVIELFRSRRVEVVLLPSPNHSAVQPFASVAGASHFTARMQRLARETGSVWLPLPAGDFQPPADADFLDYGHLNRSGGVAFTHYLRGALAALPPIR